MKAPERTESESRRRIQVEPLRLLIADDEPIIRLDLRRTLENMGHIVVGEAGDGAQAVEQSRELKPDLAILDIKMPGLSGVEVTAALRTSPDAASATIPIIALTANAFEADRASYLAAGMDACLTKPYEEADLCQLLLDLTAGAGQQG